MHADRLAFRDAAIDPHVRPGRRKAQVSDGAGGRHEVAVRIFGVEPHLDRVAPRRIRRRRQGLASSDAQLPFHQVQPGDHLRHRMFDLQARVHFHEKELAGALGDELHRAGADIADGPGSGTGGVAHPGPLRGVHARRWCFLQHLLMATLDGAIAFEQADGVAVPVGKHLDLDMAGLRQVALHQHAVVTEAGGGLALGDGQRLREFIRVLYDPHTLAAATGAGLDQHRIADERGFGGQQRRVLVCAVITWDERYARRLHQRLGLRLATHGADGGRGRAHEHQPGRRTRFGKGRILTQEAVTRMHRLRARRPGGAEDGIDT